MGDLDVYLAPVLGALLVLAAPLVDPSLTAMTAAITGAGLGVIVGAYLRVAGLLTPKRGPSGLFEAKATVIGTTFGLAYYVLQETLF